jgi:hypothetical protein
VLMKVLVYLLFLSSARLLKSLIPVLATATN